MFFYQHSGSAFMNGNAYFYGNSLHDGERLLLLQIQSVASKYVSK